ncbi:unnamed protein product [Diatraea saccharalis]|uniref:Gustatory receptor n=1 Tax=Diatraea saccharalis TaxID=40085 RepID=A0A9N9WI08_9NEOP|nr:unnamed protein product [Diatraea saccharalis]
MVVHKTAVVPNVSFLVKSKSSKSDSIPKSLRYIFVFFQIIAALDFGFVRVTSGRQKYLLKFLAFMQSSVIVTWICCLVVSNPNFEAVWLISASLKYFIFVVVLLSTKYSYCDFQNDLCFFDKEINTDSVSYRLDIKMIMSLIVVVICLVLKYVFLSKALEAGGGGYLLHFFLFDILYSIVTVSLDFVRVTYFLLFTCSRWRIEKFIKFVNQDNANIVSCQYLYKNIADVTEKAKGNFNLVFIITLMYNTISTTVHIFLPFAGGLVKTESGWKLAGDVLTVVKNFFIVLAPTFTAGLLSSEVENLVLALRDKVLIAKDEKQREDIRRFIGYIEARPLKFTVCGVVPLDWNLPVIIVNMSFTYLIVMIQFTHKY